MKSLLASALACSLLAACADPAPGSAVGARIEVAVAPLELPDLVEATYAITVRNATDTVWTAGPLSSTRYGDGRGALTYVGPCDAAGGLHTVELVLLSLTATTGPLTSPADYANPTLAPDGAVTPLVVAGVTCAADTDTRVAIDLTILRSARQGFFDFAVSFDDVFCSAKLDCREAFLHGADGVRAETAILAFACAAGEGQPTHLVMSDLALSCTDSGGATTTTTLPVAGARPGQHGAQGAGIYEWAVYKGREQLGGTALEKCYWTHALGLDVAALAGQSCRVTAAAAAGSAPFPYAAGSYGLPRVGSYPFVRWDVEVLRPDGTLCTNEALGAASEAVATDYALIHTPDASLPRLTAAMRCGGPSDLACATAAADVLATPTGDGFTLTLGDGSVQPASFVLPDGYTLGTSCCAPTCCQ